jgi:hypothetical protein
MKVVFGKTIEYELKYTLTNVHYTMRVNQKVVTKARGIVGSKNISIPYFQ